MKLRLFNNSVRLRLSQREVMLLAENKMIETRTGFFPDPLVCQLYASVALESTSVQFQAGLLKIELPAEQVRDWAKSDRVSIEATIFSTVENEPVHLLVEKDFKCLHGASENQEDYFANPLAAE